MARPSAVMRFVGIMFPAKQAVRTATPATMAQLPDLVGSFKNPSSAVPTIPSAPLRRKEKSPFNSAVVGSVWGLAAPDRWIFFHSIPPKKKNLSLPDLNLG